MQRIRERKHHVTALHMWPLGNKCLKQNRNAVFRYLSMWVTAVHGWGSGRRGGRSLLTDQILRAFHARAIVLTDRDTNG